MKSKELFKMIYAHKNQDDIGYYQFSGYYNTEEKKEFKKAINETRKDLMMIVERLKMIERAVFNWVDDLSLQKNIDGNVKVSKKAAKELNKLGIIDENNFFRAMQLKNYKIEVK